MNVALIIPTCNAGPAWKSCLDSISMQGIQPQIRIVIDSQSTDQTIELAREAGYQTKIIDRADFNHGGTRLLALQMATGADIVVYLTQDAVLADERALENIIACFSDEMVAAVCGRQLPRKGAGAIEAHARLYNYPATSFSRSYDDRFRYGLKTAFISNSFSAYRVDKLVAAGGFPEDVIFGEDMFVATRLLEQGYKVDYCADACVYHSHSYSILQEFRRYFDMGVFHAREPWIRSSLGNAESEGLKFVKSEIAYLVKHEPWRVPEGLLRTVFRLAGFKLGLFEKYMLKWMKRRLAMNTNYFL